MFDPMGAPSDPLLSWLVLGIAAVLYLAGLYWIRRAWKDIEDN